MYSNKFMNALNVETNYTLTENGAVANKSTLSCVLDMFAVGAAYRNRTDEDIILLFKKALEEDIRLALKCLFYIRDVRGGQGERRFFKVCMKWFANQPQYHDYVDFMILFIPAIGRWDDLYCFVDTPFEKDALSRIAEQLRADHKSLLDKMNNLKYEPITLCAKWAKSENTSSLESRQLGEKTRKVLGWTPKAYRKVLSMLRDEIGVLEKTLSQGDWATIEFDKLPSKAGLKYSKAFTKNKVTAAKYREFMADKNTKVNAGTLYPYDVVGKAINYHSFSDDSNTERNALNKYWDNLTDYFKDATLNALAVVDTSGSMHNGMGKIMPIDVAISIGMYCAERAKGPFANHYVSFSSRPQLVKVDGIDFVDKVHRIYKTNLVENTNIEATFDMLLETAILHDCKQEDLPQNLIIISDMEFDRVTIDIDGWCGSNVEKSLQKRTLMEFIRKKWKAHGYKMPHIIYWNVNSRQDNIPEVNNDEPISYVSGGSPTVFKNILTGKTGYDLMLDAINSDRYAFIDILFASENKNNV